MLKILIVSAFPSIIIPMIFANDHERQIVLVEESTVLAVVLVGAIVSAWNDYQKEKQFLKINAYNDAHNNFNAMRNWKPADLNLTYLNVGDLVKIKPEMSIPRDSILIRGTGVTTDESAMTGESIELKKESMDMWETRQEEKLEEEKLHNNEDKRNNHDLPSPILLSGTQIQTGEGRFMVVVVGKNSWVGKIFAKLNQEIEMTPLQEKLAAIVTDIGYIGMIAAGITLIVLFVRFFIETGIKGFDWKIYIDSYLNDWLGFLIISITIVVVAVPEGFPLAVMIALAYSVQRMLKDMNFVKRLTSCEIMGGANNICSDKTRTLTKNMMTVKEVWQGETISLEVEDESYVVSYVSSHGK